MLQKLETELKLRGFSKNTIKTYKFYNQKFLDFIKKEPAEVTQEDIKKFLADYISKDSKNTTISLIKSALCFYYEEILGKKFNIKTPKIAKKVPIVLTKKEVKKLIDSVKNPKHRIIIEFLYSTGIRLSECINFKINDLELGEKIAWVRKGKGSKDRMIILSEKLVQDLKKYLDSKKHKSEFVFSVKGRRMSRRNIQKVVKKAARISGIKKKVSPHTLRHSYATHLLENNTDIRKIQVLLGHSNLNTTQIYTSVSKTELKKIENPLDML